MVMYQPMEQQLGWSPDLWNQVHDEVQREFDRNTVLRKFVPLRSLTDALRVPADIVGLDEASSSLAIDPAQIVAPVDLSVGFVLTEQQVKREAEEPTVCTLAIAAASLLALGEETLFFQGDAARANPDNAELFRRVHVQGGPAGKGLVAAAAETIEVSPRAGEQTIGPAAVRAVADAIGLLVKAAQPGPFGAVFRTETYAQLYEPLDNTFVYAAQLIQPLVTAGLYSAATLPPNTGIVLSLGGGVMKIAVGREPATGLMFRDGNNVYHFQVGLSSAFALSNPAAAVRLNFPNHVHPGATGPASQAKASSS